MRQQKPAWTPETETEDPGEVESRGEVRNSVPESGEDVMGFPHPGVREDVTNGQVYRRGKDRVRSLTRLTLTGSFLPDSGTDGHRL